MYGLVSTAVALGLIVGTPQTSQAIPFIDLLFRGIQVIQLSSISDRQEVEIGGQINQQLVQQEIDLYNNSGIKNYINDIGQKLVPYSARPDIPYVFQVVEDDQVNAFATMGGYVYVTTGLIAAADNEAELASVISHEIGHIASRHAVEQLRERAIASGLLTATGLDRSDAVGIGVELAVRRPNSRQDELEADEKGLSNLVQAGYAPGAMVTFMEKLLNQGSIPAFLSTHPATNTRIERLNALIDPATANSGAGLDNNAYRNRIQALL
ncbi:MAG: M48 family metallopeptidase [Elainellaceae cyanobacterium]